MLVTIWPWLLFAPNPVVKVFKGNSDGIVFRVATATHDIDFLWVPRASLSGNSIAVTRGALAELGTPERRRKKTY